MSNLTVSITSNKFPELARRLPDVAARIVVKTAFDIEAYAKSIVPVDTGFLKNSITTELGLDRLSATIAPHADYAVFVEGGTRYMPARPYMYPAAEANRNPFAEAVRQALAMEWAR